MTTYECICRPTPTEGQPHSPACAWAKRDRQRAETEAFYERQREAAINGYIAIVATALRQFEQGGVLNVEATRAGVVAVRALMDAGYVFATIGSWDD